jgi:hypothetical protein
MNMLKDRLHERCLDVYEWIDYRPDADFRWLLAVPVLLALGWALGSPIGVGIALVLAAIVTVVAAVLGLISIVSWILANALVDIVTSIKLPARGTTLAPIPNDRR